MCVDKVVQRMGMGKNVDAILVLVSVCVCVRVHANHFLWGDRMHSFIVQTPSKATCE